MSEVVQPKVQKNGILRPIREAIMPKTYFASESRSWLFSPGGLLTAIVFGIIAYVHLLFVWYFIDYYQEGPENYISSPLALLSRFEGQAAILLFSIEFILAIRTRFIEKLFGGFDRVYKMHSIIGRIAMLMALLHFVFIIVESLDYITMYILPSDVTSILFGQIALASFIILVAVSVWIRLPYHIWLWTHKFIGVAFLFAGLHVWLIQPEYSNFDPYRTIFTIIWFLGIFSYLYKLFLYKYIAPSYKATVTRIEAKHEVVDLYLKIENGKFKSRPGDFVFISLTKTARKLFKEQHPFSISGIYEDNNFRLSIKDLGDFTHKLPEVCVGDEVKVYGPYGKFDDNLFAKRSDMIWIGGGIGIAPFLYMAQQFSSLPGSGRFGKRKAHLYYSISHTEENLYSEELEKAHSSDNDFTYTVWIGAEHGFLTGEEIAKSVGGVEELKKRMVFICGPLPMMHAISKQLIALGMHPRNIIFEEFAFG